MFLHCWLSEVPLPRRPSLAATTSATAQAIRWDPNAEPAEWGRQPHTQERPAKPGLLSPPKCSSSIVSVRARVSSTLDDHHPATSSRSKRHDWFPALSLSSTPRRTPLPSVAQKQSLVPETQPPACPPDAVKPVSRSEHHPQSRPVVPEGTLDVRGSLARRLDLDFPSGSRVQVCPLLTSFWFAQGAADRCADTMLVSRVVLGGLTDAGLLCKFADTLTFRRSSGGGCG